MPYVQIGEPHSYPIFDFRERKSGLLDKMEELKYPFHEERLNKGDWTVSNRVGGEIKRIKKTDPFIKKQKNIDDYSDLFASIKDGRIFTEINGLEELYEINVLIIQIEKGSDFYNRWFTAESWKSLQLDLEIESNTHIFKTHSHEETIDLIYSIWEREKKGKHYDPPINKEPRPKTLYEKQRYLLSGLEDVGAVKTKELLDYYNTPIGVFNSILTQEIQFTSSGKPKKIKGAPQGYGPKFFLKNKELLTGINYATQEKSN